MATCKAHAYNPSIYHSSSYINIFHAPRIFHSFNRHGIHTTSILKLPTSFWMVIKILEPEHCRIKSTGPNGGVLWQNWALRLKMTTARAAQPCSSQLQLHTAHILYIQVFGSVRFFFSRDCWCFRLRQLKTSSYGKTNECRKAVVHHIFCKIWISALRYINNMNFSFDSTNASQRNWHGYGI